MKISDIISRIDAVKQGIVTVEQVVEWLSEIDGRVQNEIIDLHEGKTTRWKGYKASDSDTELLVPSPYGERIYYHWVEANVNYENGEMESYLNAYSMYNAAYSEFWRYYIRTHTPKAQNFRNYGG